MGSASELVGTGALVRLGLRRDRWLLPLWIVGLVLMAGSSAVATADLYPDVASRVQAAETINATSSLVALYGRIYDPTSLGALSLIKLTAFGSSIIAVLMAMVVVRHTRADEESGRLELLSGARVGRSAPIAAALVMVTGASLLLGLLTAVALAAGGLPVPGSLLFGLGWAATGVAFGAVAAVTAQIASTGRAATGMAVAVIGVMYALRAVGDLAEPGPSFLSWLSPIGWNQQVRAFAGDRGWVLVLPLLFACAMTLAAFALRSRRDLGVGLRADRPGPATGRLTGVGALALRLQSRPLVAWAVAFVVFGLLLGSLANTLTGLLTSPQAAELIRQLGGLSGLADAFLSAEVGLLGVGAAAYGVAAMARLRSEETAGHAELLLSTAVSRPRWASSHVFVGLMGILLLMVCAGVGVGVGAALSLSDGSQVARVLAVSIEQVPAAWVVAALVLAVFGWIPRATTAVWGVLVAFVALGEFGVLWGAPEWLMNLSPFQHSPRLLPDSEVLAPLASLTVMAALLLAFGYIGWRRRDLQP